MFKKSAKKPTRHIGSPHTACGLYPTYQRVNSAKANKTAGYGKELPRVSSLLLYVSAAPTVNTLRRGNWPNRYLIASWTLRFGWLHLVCPAHTVRVMQRCCGPKLVKGVPACCQAMSCQIGTSKSPRSNLRVIEADVSRCLWLCWCKGGQAELSNWQVVPG